MSAERLGWILLVVVVLLKSATHKPQESAPEAPKPVAPAEPDIVRPEGEPDRIKPDSPTLPLPSIPGACGSSRGEGLSLSPSRRQGFLRRMISRDR